MEDEDEGSVYEGRNIIHTLLPQYDPRTTVKSFRLHEDFEFLRRQLKAVGVLHKDVLDDDACPKGVVWKRPKEFCKKPYFIKEKASRFDALQTQGGVGDCWLVAAMESLTLNDELFQWVVPMDQNFDSDYVGAFHFRIWKLDTWYDVVVDDHLPYDTINKKLYYLHSRSEDVFWACLLEKAFARFCGDGDLYTGGTGVYATHPVYYEYLEDGFNQTGVLSLSGGITEMVRPKDLPKDTKIDTYLNFAFSNNALITCTFQDNFGYMNLEESHTYSVTSVYECQTPDFCSRYLIRLMNPWGESEWTGEWSDKDYLHMKDAEIRKKLQFVDREDGEFWMSGDDFESYIEYVAISHMGPSQFMEGLYEYYYEYWRSISFRGEWLKDISDGGKSLQTRYKNPICKFKIDWKLCTRYASKSHVIIHLTHWSKHSRRDWKFIGFYVYSISSLTEAEKDDLHLDTDLRKKFLENNKALNEDTMDFKRSEERAIAMDLKLACPGEYVVIPCTEKPKEESQFLVRVFTDSFSDIWENRYARIARALLVQDNVYDEKNEGIKMLFDKVANGKDEINWMGLKEILEEAMNPKDSPLEIILGVFKYIQFIYRRLVSSEDWEPERIVFSNEECRSMVAMLDDDQTGTLSYSEFRNLWNKIRFWTEVYERHKDETEGPLHVSELRDALSSIGYDLDTRTVHSLAFIYADKRGLIYLTDFVLCGVKLETVFTRYQQNYGESGKKIIFSLEDSVNNVLIL